jgi:hypothetical protein
MIERSNNVDPKVVKGKPFAYGYKDMQDYCARYNRNNPKGALMSITPKGVVQVFEVGKVASLIKPGERFSFFSTDCLDNARNYYAKQPKELRLKLKNPRIMLVKVYGTIYPNSYTDKKYPSLCCEYIEVVTTMVEEKDLLNYAESIGANLC